MNAQAMNTIGPTRPQAAKPPVILLVEDESLVREVTREVLQHAGYLVLESSNAKEAMHLASQHNGHIDLLLTDVVMPEMNGADLAHHLQDLQPNLITVFMSGYAEAELAQKMNRKSAVHIQKPFTVDVLLSQIGAALHARLRTA
jgi:two-component system, cell cycle sensor histidine kinase and response regulator CckA